MPQEQDVTGEIASIEGKREGRGGEGFHANKSRFVCRVFYLRVGSLIPFLFLSLSWGCPAIYLHEQNTQHVVTFGRGKNYWTAIISDCHLCQSPT